MNAFHPLSHSATYGIAMVLISLTINLSSVISQQPVSKEKTGRDLRCGSISICGSEQMTQVEVCRLLGQVLDNPRESEFRLLAQNTIIREYHGRGFFEAAVFWEDTDSKASASEAALSDRIVIIEGPVYIVRRIEMLGNENTRDNVIRRRVALYEGTPYDEDLMELSIKRINQLGIFEEFTKDDVEMKVDGKEHIVDLRFKLREKPF